MTKLCWKNDRAWEIIVVKTLVGTKISKQKFRKFVKIKIFETFDCQFHASPFTQTLKKREVKYIFLQKSIETLEKQ